MPMRVGEMMVIIRAEDFASRTLRRVGSEFGQLTRAQASYARAAERLTGLREMQRSLGFIERRNRLAEQYQDTVQRTNALQRQAGFGTDPTGRFTARTAAQKAAFDQLVRSRELQEQLRKEWDHAARVVDNLEPKYRRLAMSSSALGAATAKVTAQERMLSQELQRSARLIPIERWDNLGHTMSGLGRTFQLFGAISTVSLGLAARSAAEFNTEISAAATQARDITASADQVQTRIDQLTNGFNQNGQELEGVLDLMQRFPATQQEMAAGAYEIFSGMDLENKGIIDVAKGLGLLETANQIAVAGNVSLEEATSAMITTFNNFDPQLRNTSETLDTMFDIVRFGRMRLSDFNIMMNKIAPAAADAGMALEDVGGAMAYLTTVMPSQRMVATGISRLIEALRHPDIVTGLRKMGVEVKGADGRMRALDDILQDLAKRFPALRTGQQSAAEFFRMISRIGAGGGRGQIFTAEGRRALSEILTHFDEYIDAQERIEANQGEFSATLEAQMKSLGVQWNIFLNQVRALVIAIGTEAIPVFVEIGGWIQRFLEWFQQLDPELRAQIVRWGVLISVGTLLAGVILSIGGAIVSLLAYLRLLTLGLGSSVGMSTRLFMALKTLTGLSLIIPVLIKVAMGGQPDAKDFLQAAIAGGLLGSRFGPLGAVIGTITVPVVLHITTRKPMEDAIIEQIESATRNNVPLMRKYGKFVIAQIRQGMRGEELLSRDEFAQMIETNKMLDRRERGQTEGPIRGGQKLKETQDKVNKSVEDGAKAWEKYANAMTKYRQDLRSHEEAMDQWKDSLTDATAQARIDVMSNLRGMYMDMLSENEQAFGELMQGPWLTSETFDLAKEWGITPRIQDLIQDLDMQNDQFAKWRRSLDQLLKRKLPREFIDEIRALGPEEGQGLVDNILGASPAQVNALIQQWKRRNSQIKSATKMDFVDEIERFRKAGVSMGDAIINGFQDAQVGAWFDNWIQQTFPDVISGAVAQAVSDWRAANPPPTPPKKPVAPQNPRNAADQNAGGTRTTNDNSRTATVTVNMGDSGSTASEKRAEQKRVAFEAVNIVAGIIHR